MMSHNEILHLGFIVKHQRSPNGNKFKRIVNNKYLVCFDTLYYTEAN